MKTETIMWLFPIIFMIHDFEEVIMFKPWVTKNAGFMKKRFPRLAARMLPHMEGLSTSSFALAVAGMFLIVSAVTLISVELDLYSLWAGAVIGYFIHLVIHVTQFLVVRRYVPVVVTSLVTAPYCVWALSSSTGGTRCRRSRRSCGPWRRFVIIVGAVYGMHALAARFERWLKAAF